MSGAVVAKDRQLPAQVWDQFRNQGLAHRSPAILIEVPVGKGHKMTKRKAKRQPKGGYVAAQRQAVGDGACGCRVAIANANAQVRNDPFLRVITPHQQSGDNRLLYPHCRHAVIGK